MKQEIFREYDIRGIVGRDITPELARIIGAAVVAYAEEHGASGRLAVIGHDHRLSSPELAKAAAAGVMSAGYEVIETGCVPTPAYYYALKTLGATAGIMITASHNPPEYNGFKVNLGTDSLFADQIQELYRLAQRGVFPRGDGRSSSRSVLDAYREEIVRRCPLARRLRVVVDAGNGTAGLVAPGILERLGCEVIRLYCDVDGTFPNHHPDPTVPANLEDLISSVRENHADLGIAFDGDADRIGVVDETGRIIWGDSVLAIYAKDLLTRHPGEKIIYEVKCSMALEEVILAHGGVPMMYKTGHSIIKKKMKDEHALLAGEMSGHMFFAEDYFGFDDATYAAALLCRILSRVPGPFSTLLSDVPSYPSTPEIRILCAESDKRMIVEAVREQFRKTHRIIDVDGVRVIFPDGWGLVRISNTQAILVLRFEARTTQALVRILDVFKQQLGRFSQLDLSPLDYPA